ncbi:MAG: LemA family protein [Bacteroides sp.]|nr:LemA family protein [Bacteroides sp.]MCM1378667.1 LemA family protein [Bacteroides sp.]MCM1444940.1 LemA family protein [Prevotella sp.]
MKKALTILAVALIAIVVLFCGMGCSKYNSMTRQLQNVESAWSNVETQYQRRADLIPNLEATVKGYAEHESSTLEAVTEARAKVGSMSINIDDLDEATLQKYTQAQNELSGALKSLLAVSEAYPELKANENFMRFQDELAGTENRIQTARRDYNEVAREYNTQVSLFPTNIFAGFFGFQKKPYFQSAEGADQAPRVSF